MERLTDPCWKNLDPWECCGQDKFCNRDCHEAGGCTNGCIVPKLYVRLAGYEDTCLEPWQADAAKNIVEMAFEDKPERAERIRELMRADKEGRVVVLPCKLGVDMVNRILPEQPFPMENVRLSITYYSRGRMYNMSLRTFEGAVKTGKIVVAGTDTEKAMEDKKNG